MITACFGMDCNGFVSCEVSGHAGYADKGNDIVCAAVTSCVEMTANTLTDVMHTRARVRVARGQIRVTLDAGCTRAQRQLLEGLYLHLHLLAAQYPGHVSAWKYAKHGGKPGQADHHHIRIAARRQGARYEGGKINDQT